MGHGSGPASVAEAPAVPLAVRWDAPPAFDEETCQALVEIACGLLNDGAGAIVRAVAKKETGDNALADEAAKAVQMTEKVESAIRRGAIACAKKYSVRLDYAPEIMLGGGLLVWGGQVSVAIKTLKQKGQELRAANERS